MSITPKFLVTGATGYTASYTIPTLLEKGVQVRALVHRFDARSEKLAQLGVEVVQGDLLDFYSVRRALEGITGVYFLYPILTPGILSGTTYLIQAAREAGVTSIVNMSQISARREAKSNAAQDHWMAERMLDLSGLKVTHIRPTFFAEWLIYDDSVKKQDKIILPFGDGRYAPIAAEDQGRVIAELLVHPEGHEGKVYPLFGPVEYNEYEIAEVLTQELGRPITYEPISIETYQQVATQAGYHPHFIQHVSSVAQDCRDGRFAGTNDEVVNLTGRQPLGIREFIRQHRTYFE
jgi:NAD(P)H dehydrogenase (quinone)